MLGEMPVSTRSLLRGTEIRTLSRRATVPLVALLTWSKSMFLAARVLRLSVTRCHRCGAMASRRCGRPASECQRSPVSASGGSAPGALRNAPLLTRPPSLVCATRASRCRPASMRARSEEWWWTQSPLSSSTGASGRAAASGVVCSTWMSRSGTGDLPRGAWPGGSTTKTRLMPALAMVRIPRWRRVRPATCVLVGAPAGKTKIPCSMACSRMRCRSICCCG